MVTEFLPIGISKKERLYYLWYPELCLNCSECDQQIKKEFVLYSWSKRAFNEFEQRIFCIECFGVMKFQSKVNGTYVLVNIGEKPLDLIPVYPSVLIPEMGDFAHSVGGKTYSEEDMKKENMAYIINHCKHALNPNQSMMEGCEPERIAEQVKERVHALDKPLSASEGIDVLEGLGKAKAYSWAEQDKEEELLEEARRLDESKNGRRLIT